MIHELQGSGSLRKCLRCLRWFHNEADAGEELEECPSRTSHGLIVRARGACQRCGKEPPGVVLHCAHIISRSYVAIRWDERNALCLDAGCHLWAHKHPVEWTLFVEDLIGAELLRELHREAQNYVHRIKRVDYEELVAELQAKLESLES